MDYPDFREFVSSSSHGLAFLAVIPATVWLLRASSWDRIRQHSLMVYAAGLLACFGASTGCHAMAAAGRISPRWVAIDHIAIYLLIAGTYTPIARHLLPRGWMGASLGLPWVGAAIGTALNLDYGPVPPAIETSIYLVLGWGGLVCYAGMHRQFSHRRLVMVPLGGIFYTIGAMCHLAKWPQVWPGVVGPHEVFHLFVIAGAACHFGFLFLAVARRPLAGPRLADERIPAMPKIAKARI